MNCLANPTQRTGEPEAPARASVPERFRHLKRNEAALVWRLRFKDERLGLQLWEGPGVFRAGSFARPIYRKKETERVEVCLLKTGVVHLTAALTDTPAIGLATRIIMRNAWQDPEVPARSATIKPAQALWQNSSR
jgi:hypothetical protein